MVAVVCLRGLQRVFVVDSRDVWLGLSGVLGGHLMVVPTNDCEFWTLAVLVIFTPGPHRSYGDGFLVGQERCSGA